ncbi:MAG TPA: hypothetical protein DIV46_06700, partial [Verrucomicrobiales bacterium]|nr:hypothetical protein [Verrucomicrobiales bacterium]
NSNFEGITDFYSGITKPGLPGGLVFKGFLHYYMDDSLDANYGWEADMVLVKKINPSTTAILKAAYFQADDFFNDIAQVSMQVDYKF